MTAYKHETNDNFTVTIAEMVGSTITITEQSIEWNGGDYTPLEFVFTDTYMAFVTFNDSAVHANLQIKSISGSTKSGSTINVPYGMLMMDDPDNSSQAIIY